MEDEIKMGVLSPRQFRRLLEQPKREIDRIKLEFLLNTGMRYIEARNFRFSHFDPASRKIHKMATGDTRKQRERFITLTPAYAERLQFVQKLLKIPPTKGLDFPPDNNFQKNLQYWLKKAGLKAVKNPDAKRRGSQLRLFRKTRECWLVLSGYDSALVALDQGHSNLTQLGYYLNNPFSEEDLPEIRQYTQGWRTPQR